MSARVPFPSAGWILEERRSFQCNSFGGYSGRNVVINSWNFPSDRDNAVSEDISTSFPLLIKSRTLRWNFQQEGATATRFDRWPQIF